MNIETQTTKDPLKKKLEEYLNLNGINTKKPFRCLNPDHEDKKPSMSFDNKRHKAKCFACGADYDIFDIIGFNHQLNEFNSQLSKAKEIFRMTDNSTIFFKGAKQNDIKKDDSKDYSLYFDECRSKIHKTDYLKGRCITEKTLEAFKIGYDDKINAIVIPTSKNSYCSRYVENKGVTYKKTGPACLFNSDCLKKNGPVFIVEGEIDALSVIEIGANAVGLGSVSNKNKLVQLVKNEAINCPLLILLDSDDVGKKTANDLKKQLDEIGASSEIIQILDKYKDPNEFLVADKNGFKDFINETIERLAGESSDYVSKNSAHSNLSRFQDAILKNMQSRAIKTGYQHLDTCLDGGLHEGLYILGAISSLGKTTFLSQMADNIAKNGEDVLIFSLEMSRHEIMAKSLSRITFERCNQNKNDTRNAKTVRGILDGSRYSKYSQNEVDLINTAFEEYEAYSKNIFILEGIGDVSVEKIRQSISEHKKVRNKYPVVIVDYLQIIAPISDRLTDKQTIDKNVLELKRISRDFNITVFAVSSFNRTSYKDAVSMEAFKESGAIEYSSDVLIGLQLKGVGDQNFNVNEAKQKYPRDVELVILKNRNGRIGDKVDFKYHPMFNVFDEVGPSVDEIIKSENVSFSFENKKKKASSVRHKYSL